MKKYIQCSYTNAYYVISLLNGPLNCQQPCLIDISDTVTKIILISLIIIYSGKISYFDVSLKQTVSTINIDEENKNGIPFHCREGIMNLKKNHSTSVTFLSLRNLEAAPEEAMQVRRLIKSSNESLGPYMFGKIKFWNF